MWFYNADMIRSIWNHLLPERVRILLLLGNSKRAERICRDNIKHNPKDLLAHKWLARTLWKQQCLEEAIDEFQLAISFQRTTLTADRLDLIKLLLQAEHYERVLHECDKLLDPTFNRAFGIFKQAKQYAAYEARYQAYLGLKDYRNAKQALLAYLPFHKGKGRQQVLRYIEFCNRQIKQSES